MKTCIRCDKPGHVARDCKARIDKVFPGRYVLAAVKLRTPEGDFLEMSGGMPISKEAWDAIAKIMVSDFGDAETKR